MNSVVIAQACSELLELQIPVDMAFYKKIQRIPTTVKESQTEIGKVRLELQLQISGLKLKLQPTTPPKVREQHEATIKEEIDTLDTAVKGCTQLFQQTMELWTSLQEDPTLQKIEANIR